MEPCVDLSKLKAGYPGNYFENKVRLHVARSCCLRSSYVLKTVLRYFFFVLLIYRVFQKCISIFPSSVPKVKLRRKVYINIGPKMSRF